MHCRVTLAFETGANEAGSTSGDIQSTRAMRKGDTHTMTGSHVFIKKSASCIYKEKAMQCGVVLMVPSNLVSIFLMHSVILTSNKHFQIKLIKILCIAFTTWGELFLVDEFCFAPCWQIHQSQVQSLPVHDVLPLLA